MEDTSLDQALEDWTERLARALEGEEDAAGRRLGAVEIQTSLVDEAQIQKLNREYRSRDKPTDVLSFPSPEVFRAHGQLGEVIICEEVLRRQAEGLGHAAELELLVLLVHGSLHLLGFDHERGDEDAVAMSKRELALLSRLIPPQWQTTAAEAALIERTSG
jgi:probable rRNA maturation factor